MPVADLVVEALRTRGYEASQVGVGIAVGEEDGGHITYLPVDDNSLTPGPDKPDWIAFLSWHASTYNDAHELVYVVEKPWKYPQEYAAFLVDAKLEERA